MENSADQWIMLLMTTYNMTIEKEYEVSWCNRTVMYLSMVVVYMC